MTGSSQKPQALTGKKTLTPAIQKKVGSYTILLGNTVYTFFKPQQRSWSPYSVIFHNELKSDAKYILNYQIHSSTFSVAILHP